MRRPALPHVLVRCVALLVLAGSAGCGLGTAGGQVPSGILAGPLADVSLEGAEIAVGSKNFTEQLLLGKIAVILLKSSGADVEDLTNIPGSASAREAQLQGQVDIMWDYTGTAWISYLGHDDGIPAEIKQYRAVRDEDLRTNGLVWLPPAPMNNTYGFATPKETARRLGVSRLSDLAEVPADQRTFCVESEFANRNDGLQPMLETYDIPLGTEVARDNIKTLNTGAIYAATDEGVCNFGPTQTLAGRPAPPRGRRAG